MLLPRELPSIRRFAGNLWEMLDQGKLIILCCPATDDFVIWLNAALAALEETARRRGEAVPVRLAPMSADCSNPLTEIYSALTLDFIERSGVAGMLECDGREAACLLTIECSGELSSEWTMLFKDIGRIYRTLGAEIRQRPILAMLMGCPKAMPVEEDVAIKVRGLWNVVRWEEIRLLADSMLAQRENALFRAWRVAVYSAASNGNPDLIKRLCEETPNSLNEAIETSLDFFGCDGRVKGFDYTSLHVADQRWQVPSSVESQWAAGQISGLTLERGSNINLRHNQRVDADAYLRRAICREQISGLLPVVLEMGYSASRAVTEELGDRLSGIFFQSEYGLGGQLYLEPGEMTNRLQENSLRVSKVVWDLLKLLQTTRNNLAHVSPINYSRIQELWQKYDLVRRRLQPSRPLVPSSRAVS